MYNRDRQYRLKNYDYSSDGFYFVTICTKNRNIHLGKIVREKIHLSKIGTIVKKYWNLIPQQFKTIFLDDYILMPNHLHGIIIINNRRSMIYHGQITNRKAMMNHGPTADPDEFIKFNDNFNYKNPKPKSGIINNPMRKINISLGKTIRWFKGRCSYEINKKYPRNNFSWQERFYDRIIRDNNELEEIREYIRNNPTQWESDKNFIFQPYA